MRIPRPAPATIIAFAALFVALGGPSQAAQLARKVTHHSHSLRGPRGPKGTFAKPIIVTATINPIGGGGRALCPPRSIATGGGVNAAQGLFVNESAPQPSNSPQGWTGLVANPPGGTTTPAGNVIAVCVPTS